MKRAFTLVAIVLSLLAVINCGGCGRRTIAKLDKEPQVSVVDKAGAERSMPIEEYVMAVVAGEMGQLPAAGEGGGSWPDNAYAAQAILARSFIMEYLSAHEGAAITTDVEEAQAFKPEGVTPQIRQAVNSTRGMVLVSNGRYLKTWFHSYSGGRTATASEGLNYKAEAPYTKSVKLPNNEYVPANRKHWTTSFTKSEIKQALEAKGMTIGDITNITIAQRGPSGRVTQVLITSQQGTRTMHGAEFRLALGAEKMLSTLVDQDGLQVRGEQVIMSGSGFGHGVGLSQWDAYKLAKEGKSPEQIVMVFFQNARVEKAWD